MAARPEAEVEFSVTIEADSGSVAQAPEREIARMLRMIADRIEGGSSGSELVDKNGDEVGDWELSVEWPERDDDDDRADVD